MAKIVYFVVAVDLETKSAYIDDDTFLARFSRDEAVFDEDAGEWHEDDDLVHYNKALDILNSKPIERNGN